MFHWVPQTMSPQDTKKASQILESGGGGGQRALEGGGGVDQNEYTHVDADGNVLDRVRSPSIRNAAVYFMNGAWDEPHTAYLSDTTTAPYIPLNVRESVINAVEKRFMCACASPECSNPACDERAFKWARDYLREYGCKSEGTPPPVVRVMGADQRVHTFTPQMKPLTSPTEDDVRDGVLAKLSITVS